MTWPPANFDLTCLGCGRANLDTEACPDSGTHPGVAVGEWKVHAYCLDCCGCPEHSQPVRERCPVCRTTGTVAHEPDDETCQRFAEERRISQSDA